jgi:glutathione S-transferase
MSVTFYTNPMSRGAIVQWMLEETGCDYTVETIEYGPQMKSPEYLAINPMGKVPAIKHNGKIVTECAAICAYLADAFPESNLAPSLDKRADYYRWLFFAAGPLEMAVTLKACDFQAKEEQQRMLGFGTLQLTVDTLASAVKGKRFIAADQFTAADVYIGSQIGWGMQFGSLEPRDEFVAYYHGLKDRPANQKAMAVMQQAMEAAKNQADNS